MNPRQKATYRRYAWRHEGGAETMQFIVLSAICIITLLAAAGLGLTLYESGAGTGLVQRLNRLASGQAPDILQRASLQQSGIHGTNIQEVSVPAPSLSAPNIQGVSVPAPSLSAPNIQGVSVSAPSLSAPNIQGPTITTPVPVARGAVSAIGTTVMMLVGIGIAIVPAVFGFVHFRARMRSRRML